MSNTEQKLYSFDIRAGTTNLDEPITSIDYTVIANDLDQVIEWCKTEYDMSKLEEINSDESYAFFEYNYYCTISDHGNIIETEQSEDNYDYDNDQPKENYGFMRDTLEISGSEISKNDYKYLTSGKYHNSVINLVEEQ